MRGRERATLANIESLYRASYGRFVRVATAVTGDPALAADAVHDAFVAAVRHRGAFRGEGTLDAWLWRAVVNAARKRRRSGATNGLPVFEPLGRDNSDTDGDVRAAVARLPERQRVALFLRYYADLDYRAIADVLAVKPGTVAATPHAAREAVRRALEEADRCTT